MTECNNVRQFLHPYIDGELDGDERVEMDVHLDGCPQCRDEVTVYAGMRATIRRHAEAPAMPEGLEQRVRARIEAEDNRERSRPFIPWSIAAALAILIGSASGFMLHRGQKKDMVRDVVRRHARMISVSPANSSAMNKARPARAARLPSFPNNIVRPVGYTTFATNGGTASHGMFRAKGRPLSVMVLPRNPAPPRNLRRRCLGRRCLFVGYVDGYTVVLWRGRSGRTYTATSDLGEDDLVQLVEHVE